MKIWPGRLSIIIFLVSSTALAHQSPDIVPLLNFDTDYIVPSEAVEDSYLTVAPDEVHYQTLADDQKARFELALSLLEETLNSEEFKRLVLSYKNSDGKRGYKNNYLWADEENPLSNEEIFNIIKAGDERMIPETSGEMNIFSWIKKCTWRDLNRKWCNVVIGSTDPRNSKWIKLNHAYYNKLDAPSMVNNLIHEWIHLLGFLHGAEHQSEEAPYVIGEIAENVSRKILLNRR